MILLLIRFDENRSNGNSQALIYSDESEDESDLFTARNPGARTAYLRPLWKYINDVRIIYI